MKEMQASIGARCSPAGRWLNVSLAIPRVVIARATLRDQGAGYPPAKARREGLAGDATRPAGSYWR